MEIFFQTNSFISELVYTFIQKYFKIITQKAVTNVLPKKKNNSIYHLWSDDHISLLCKNYPEICNEIAIWYR